MFSLPTENQPVIIKKRQRSNVSVKVKQTLFQQRRNKTGSEANHQNTESTRIFFGLKASKKKIQELFSSSKHDCKNIPPFVSRGSGGISRCDALQHRSSPASSNEICNNLE